MKLYIVYFRTMEDSPEVTILCATASRAKAEAEYAKAKALEAEFMEDRDEDDSNWAEARMDDFDCSERLESGDTVYVYVETEWYEAVVTTVQPFFFKVNAESQLKWRKQILLEEFPDAEPFDEDETIEEAMHFEDPDIQVDLYFDIVPVVLQ